MFRSTVVAALFLVACGSLISTSGLAPPAACNASGVRPLLDGVTPGIAVDGIELVNAAPKAGFACTLAEQTGTICGGAANLALCEQIVAAECGTSSMQSCASADCLVTRPAYVVFTRGDDVETIRSKEALVAFLAPIDTPEDAILVATMNGTYVPCGQDGTGTRPSADGDGYDLVTLVDVGCGATDRVLDHVARDGIVTELEREHVSDAKPPCALE